MNSKDLIVLIESFAASGLAHMHYQSGATVVELDRNATALAAPTDVLATSAANPDVAAARVVASTAVPAADGAAASEGATPVHGAAELPAIVAPFVGTFYAKPAPDKEPFVSAGDTVKAGQTVCLIEAMKMMSEVQAPCDCVIEQVVATDGELVSFDAPLMRYREV